MTNTIALVACVSKKMNTSMPARKLYCSDWFIKASRYAEQVAEEWYILSARYGLISPDQVINPYNETLNKMPVKQRRAWAQNVIADLRKVILPGTRMIILAGSSYRKYLLVPIQQMDCKVEIPMEGLRIGEQLSWLKRRIF